MSQIKFQQLINDFSPASLSDIFKSHDFFRVKQNSLPTIKDEKFTDFSQLGDFDLEDNTNIVVICARSLAHLNERASRKTQYDISKKILKIFQKSRAGIFIYYDSKGDFRVSLIYADYLGTKVNYSTFRRFTYFVSKQQTNTTFLQQVASLSFTNFTELKELFSVEKVTKEFFKKYRDLFLELLEDFEQNEEFKNVVVDKKISSTPDFVKKLMGQIVFLYFVQKKGWLGVRPNENWGTGNQAFLRFLFETCKKADKNYFNDYLEPLFYKALAEKNKDDYFEPLNCKIPFLNGGLFESVYDWENTQINIHNKTLGKVLDFFDQYNFTVDENTPSDQEISVDPEMLGKIFENLLEVKDRKDKGAFYTPREIVHYMCRESLIQHLVSENTVPEDRIRKIFENKDTDLSVLVDDERKTATIKKMQDLKDIAEKVDLSLRNIKIVDPAVGSGAFPMGMLNEISSVRYFLNSNFLHKLNTAGKELTLYDIKKETLENCIYAVDIEPGAVEIAKLRFWLALIVEYESSDSNIAPPTLPNLDYKIMQGNSLLEEYEGVKLFDEKLLKQPLINAEIFTQENQLISKLQSELMSFYMKNPEWMQKKGEHKNKPEEVKNLENKIRDLLKQKKKIDEDSVDQKDLFTSSTGDSKLIWDEIKSKHKRFFSESDREKKKDLRKQIDNLNWLLIESTLEEQKNDSALEKLKELKKTNTKPFFLWHLYFADVFEEKGGFDIVIGNPPYISALAASKSIDKNIREYYKSNFISASGTYDIYLLFFEQGISLLKKDGSLIFITPTKYLSANYAKDFRDKIGKSKLKMIVDFSRVRVFESAGVTTFVSMFSNSNLKEDVFSYIYDQILNFNSPKIIKNKRSSLDRFPESLWGHLITENFYLLDKIFAKSELFESCFSVNGSSTASEADNFCKYINGNKIGQKIINTGSISPFVSRWSEKAYSNKKEKILKPYMDLKMIPVRRKEMYLAKKLIISKLAKNLTCVVDNKGEYASTNTTFVYDFKNEELLKFTGALINSRLYNFIYKNIFSGLNLLGSFQFQAPQIRLLPFPKKGIIEINNISEISKLVDKIMASKNLNPDDNILEIEDKIDNMIYKLYDLTPEEIEIVENSSKK